MVLIVQTLKFKCKGIDNSKMMEAIQNEIKPCDHMHLGLKITFKRSHDNILNEML